jgi:hypothetical protein
MMFLPANYGLKGPASAAEHQLDAPFQSTYVCYSGCRLNLFETVVWQQRLTAPTGYR